MWRGHFQADFQADFSGEKTTDFSGEKTTGSRPTQPPDLGLDFGSDLRTRIFRDFVSGIYE